MNTPLHLRVAVALGLITALTVGPPAARWAGLAATASARQTLSSATLHPASDLSVTTGCSLLILGPKADLSWTATYSTFATGYEVERWRGSILEEVTSVTPRTTTTLTQTGLQSATSFTWVVQAFHVAWTSTQVSVTGSTPGVCL